MIIVIVIFTSPYQWLSFAFCCLRRSTFGDKPYILPNRSTSNKGQNYGDDDNNDDDGVCGGDDNENGALRVTSFISFPIV